VTEPIRIALVYPELLGTYGDRGNAEMLAWHAVRHGLTARLVEVPAGQPIPAGLDAYLLGGGEDTAQATAARLLRSPAGDGLRWAIDERSAVLAVCGAFQLLGRSYIDAAGRQLTGLGLLDLDTAAGTSRLVGEVVARTRDGELLTGFENHGGRTLLGQALEPLGIVLRGNGNNGVDGTEGARQGGLIGTYLHGPVLARNPFLAEALLHAILDRRGLPFHPLDPARRDPAADLHRARLRAVLGGRRLGRRRWPRPLVRRSLGWRSSPVRPGGGWERRGPAGTARW
jgi:CobQ-like glutamine amidotransferase family enzyme